MARQGVSTGTTPNDGTGDTLLAGAVKINSNFSEVYGIIGDGTNAYVGIVTQLVAGSNISISTSYGSVTITGSGSGSVAGIDTLGTSGFSGVVVSGVGTLGVTSTTNLSAQRLNVSGVSTFSGDVLISSTSRAYFNSASTNNLHIYDQSGGGNIAKLTGEILVGAPTISLRGGALSEYMLKATKDGSVDLYYDNSKKFETTGAGVTVTGTTSSNQLNISGISTFNGKTRILDDVEFHVGTNGASGDYKFYRDSGNNYNVVYEDISGGEARFIGNVSGSGNDSNFTFLKSSNALAKFTQNGILLYANNGERFRTNGDGIIVTGGAVVSGVVTASTLHVGLVTASSTTGVTTYYGDTSNAVDGRWVLSGDGSNYTFTGIGITSGNNTDPILYLARARVYEFVNTQPSSHPLVIRDSNGGTQWTAGVSTSFDGTNDILRFEVPMNAPNGLYYQCTNHAGMGNNIVVYPNVS